MTLMSDTDGAAIRRDTWGNHSSAGWSRKLNFLVVVYIAN